MKKVIFIFAALMAVFASVAAVSAFEGHAIDIKAHVENAIGVQTYELNYGTSFPQETRETQVTFGLSQSFMAQNRLSSVDYMLAFELKPASENGATPPSPLYQTSYFEPLNPFLTVTSLNGRTTIGSPTVYQAIPAVGGYSVIGTGELASATTLASWECIHFKFSVPVFQGYYNSITDKAPTNWTYGMLTSGQFNLANETINGQGGTINVVVPNADLGIDFKIQVTGFNN